MYENSGHQYKEDPLFFGYQDLDTEKDSGYHQLLMHADNVELNGGEFKIINRQLRAANHCKALWIHAEPIGKTELKDKYPFSFFAL